MSNTDTGRDNGEVFLELLRESVITQAIITVIVLVIVGVLLLRGQAVPQELYYAMFSTIAFYFGSKQGLAQGRAAVLAQRIRGEVS